MHELISNITTKKRHRLLEVQTECWWRGSFIDELWKQGGALIIEGWGKGGRGGRMAK